MKTFTAEQAIALAKQAYANAIQDMSEVDILDDFERDTAIGEAIEKAFNEASQ
jgi:hypothetical protein